MKINPEKEAKTLLSELLKLLNIKAEVSTTLDDTGDEPVLKINLETEESGLLIGSHGSTINAIQSFIALSLRQKTGEWLAVSLDVGDWRLRHEDYLQNLARQAAERAQSTGEPQYLYNLTPAQRRIIHMHLAEEGGIITESEGEGSGRFLIVKAK